MSSDESRDPRPMAHLWCRACNHCMHTSAHCKRHFKRKPTHQCFGVHCACCNRTYTWEEMVPHLNVRHAHKRAAIVDHPPSPRTTSPDQSCSTDSGPRYQPYTLPAGPASTTAAPRRRSGPLRTYHTSVPTQSRQAPEAALGAPPASPMLPASDTLSDGRYNSGFGLPIASSVPQTYHPRPDAIPNPGLGYPFTLPELHGLDTQLDVSSGSTVGLPVSTQPLHIPDASWSQTSSPLQPTLPLAAYIASMYSVDDVTATSTFSSPLTLMSTDDLFIRSSTPGHSQTSDAGDLSVTSRASSVDTTTSRASATTASDAGATQRRPADSMRLPASTATPATGTSPSTTPDYVTDRQLLQMAIGQLLWTFGIISMHVRHTDPSDVADSMGRHLLQSHGHWLIPLQDAMNMPLTDIVALLRPVWSQLYHSRRE